MSYTIYDPSSGLISSRVSNSNQIRGRAHVSGNFNPQKFYIQAGQAMPFPPRPLVQDHVVLVWKDLSWQIDLVRTETRARALRDKKLGLVDRMNPIWWQSLDPADQQQVMTYRQSLLDVTDQPGWPTVLEWPSAPAWL